MLIAQGESAKYVCDQMGHSSIQLTFDTYGHLFPQARCEASSELEETMFAKRKELSVETLVETWPNRRRRNPAPGGQIDAYAAAIVLGWNGGVLVAGVGFEPTTFGL